MPTNTHSHETQKKETNSNERHLFWSKKKIQIQINNHISFELSICDLMLRPEDRFFKTSAFSFWFYIFWLGQSIVLSFDVHCVASFTHFRIWLRKCMMWIWECCRLLSQKKNKKTLLKAKKYKFLPENTELFLSEQR